jgi:hypothetical protein
MSENRRLLLCVTFGHTLLWCGRPLDGSSWWKMPPNWAGAPARRAPMPDVERGGLVLDRAAGSGRRALRTRPDRLVVGECRRVELVDLLRALKAVLRLLVGRQWIIQLRSQLFSGQFSNALKSSVERLR